jgi:hypothetical protein
MAYPGQPQQYPDPNQGYGQQQPAPVYNTEPISPAYGAPQSVPPQPQPTHDQGAFGQPAAGGPVYQQPASGGPYAAGTQQLPTYGPDPAQGGYDPYGQQPMSSPPMTSAMPAQTYPPMSGVPMSGGAGYGTAGPPPQKKGLAVPLLAGLLALAVIAAGVFIGLYVNESGKLDKSEKLAAQRQTSLDSANTDLDKTKKDLQSKTDELTQAQQDLRGSKNDSEQAKKERDIVGTCLKLLTEALDASDKGDKATFDSKVAQLDQPCKQAFTIIGIS